MIRRLFQRLLARLGRSFNQSLVNELREQQKRLHARVEASETRMTAIIRETAEVREAAAARQQRGLDTALRDLARQQVDIRLAMTSLRTSARGRVEGGPRIPVSASDLPPDDKPEAQTTVPKDSILELSSCPVCQSVECTPVCEYNKLLLLESGVDEEARVYNYAMCHSCGIVYARRRPAGPRYIHLLERFEVTLGRAQDGIPRNGNIAISSAPLSDEDRRVLRDKVAKGVFVSEHTALPRREYLPALLQDRMSNSVHIELIGSLLPLKSPRVLELRPRLGSIGAGLTRLYGAEVYGMPLFDGQQFLIHETYGIRADHKVDYDRFSIPYPGQFDLVIANHMFTHSIRPGELFATIRERLTPGGHLYLYNEPDERDFLGGGKSMINSLNAFHMQTFDAASISRALAAVGFDTVFLTHQDDNLIALARAVAQPRWTSMSAQERERRLRAYRSARDLAILRLPERVRPRFADEWDAVVERAFAARLVDFDERGRLRLVKHGRAEAD